MTLIDWTRVQAGEDRQDARRQAALDQARGQARADLAATDWYVVRAGETGKPVPEDVSALRSRARRMLSEAACRPGQASD